MAAVGICTTGTAPHLRKRQAVTCPAGLVGCSVCSQHLHSRCSVPPYSQRLWCRCAAPPTLGICRTGVPQHAQWVSAVQANLAATAGVCSSGVHPQPVSAAGVVPQHRQSLWAEHSHRGACQRRLQDRCCKAPLEGSGQGCRRRKRLNRVCFPPVHHFRARPHNSTWWGIA